MHLTATTATTVTAAKTADAESDIASCGFADRTFCGDADDGEEAGDNDNDNEAGGGNEDMRMFEG